jgi:hypothetical protein
MEGKNLPEVFVHFGNPKKYISNIKITWKFQAAS